MKKVLMCILSVLVVFWIGFSACSKSEEVETEKGKIEKFTDQIAEEALQGIKTPINKARAVQDMADKNVKALDNPYGEEQPTGGIDPLVVPESNAGVSL